MNEKLKNSVVEITRKEIEENKELNINPLPLPGRKNGLSLENAYVVETYAEEEALLQWVAEQVGKASWKIQGPAYHRNMKDLHFIQKDDKIFERVTVVYFDDNGFLIRRANYYFDITSYYTYFYCLGIDKPVEHKKKKSLNNLTEGNFYG